LPSTPRSHREADAASSARAADGVAAAAGKGDERGRELVVLMPIVEALIELAAGNRLNDMGPPSRPSGYPM